MVQPMPKFTSRAQRYRDRADELPAKADNFQDPANRAIVMVLAEEYLAMGDRLEEYPTTASPERSAIISD